mmetsp:Transcript_10900/g.20509  ORF Transcript_10900/g.20509 Transcript_10900/m.20509 type:complete len:253 (-) Transcript_10900:843-1601(-)
MRILYMSPCTHCRVIAVTYVVPCDELAPCLHSSCTFIASASLSQRMCSHLPQTASAGACSLRPWQLGLPKDCECASGACSEKPSPSQCPCSIHQLALRLPSRGGAWTASEPGRWNVLGLESPRGQHSRTSAAAAALETVHVPVPARVRARLPGLEPGLVVAEGPWPDALVAVGVAVVAVVVVAVAAAVVAAAVVAAAVVVAPDAGHAAALGDAAAPGAADAADVADVADIGLDAAELLLPLCGLRRTGFPPD